MDSQEDTSGDIGLSDMIRFMARENISLAIEVGIGGYIVINLKETKTADGGSSYILEKRMDYTSSGACEIVKRHLDALLSKDEND